MLAEEEDKTTACKEKSDKFETGKMICFHQGDQPQQQPDREVGKSPHFDTLLGPNLVLLWKMPFTKGSAGTAGWNENTGPATSKLDLKRSAVLSNFNPRIYKCSTASLQSVVLLKRTGWTYLCHQTAPGILRARSQQGRQGHFLMGFKVPH